MGITQLFRKKSYNGEKPFVLVDISGDDPSRGDVHGFTGIAKRVAKKTGAEYLQVDNAMLDALYPDIPVFQNNDYEGYKRAKSFKRLFAEKGYPDFYFCTRNGSGVLDILNCKAMGVAVTTINESISDRLLSFNWYSAPPERRLLVPHHLTPELLAEEGRRFATEFEELPRPFIGVIISSLGWNDTDFAEKISALQDAYPEATVFLNSSWRTSTRDLQNLTQMLQERFDAGGGKFRLVTFDYAHQSENEGISNFWNPYAGLLDQADHLIIKGVSLSMQSEVLATGKTLHVADEGFYLHAKPHFCNLSAYKKGEPLMTENFAPLDITESIADAIVRAQAEKRAEAGVLTPARAAVNAVKAALRMSPRSLYTKV